jgi:hypothetical protein
MLDARLKPYFHVMEGKRRKARPSRAALGRLRGRRGLAAANPPHHRASSPPPPRGLPLASAAADSKPQQPPRPPGAPVPPLVLLLFFAFFLISSIGDVQALGGDQPLRLAPSPLPSPHRCAPRVEEGSTTAAGLRRHWRVE